MFTCSWLCACPFLLLRLMNSALSASAFCLCTGCTLWQYTFFPFPPILINCCYSGVTVDCSSWPPIFIWPFDNFPFLGIILLYSSFSVSSSWPLKSVWSRTESLNFQHSIDGDLDWKKAWLAFSTPSDLCCWFWFLVHNMGLHNMPILSWSSVTWPIQSRCLYIWDFKFISESRKL